MDCCCSPVSLASGLSFASSSPKLKKSRAFSTQLVDASRIVFCGVLQSNGIVVALDFNLVRPISMPDMDSELTILLDPDCDIRLIPFLRMVAGGEEGLFDDWACSSPSPENETRRVGEEIVGVPDCDTDSLTVSVEAELSMNGQSAVVEKEAGNAMALKGSGGIAE